MPAWAPDGEHLVSQASDPGKAPWIQVMPRNGGPVVRLTPGSLPSWSPESRTLAFVDVATVFVIECDGSKRRALCPGTFPRWSPSGGSILVQRSTPELGPHLVTLAPDSSRECVLAREAGFGFWSQDGRRVAFWRGDDLFVIDADGTNERSLGLAEE